MRSYSQALEKELERKAALFEDDAAFLVEVHEGKSLAPGMDPHMELQTLKLRFSDFSREFKVGRGAPQLRDKPSPDWTDDAAATRAPRQCPVGF